MQQLGKLVRTARQHKGWKQSDLAAASGVTQSYISQIERGTKYNIPLETLQALAAALDLPAADLVRAVPPLPTPVAELQAEGLKDEEVARLVAIWPQLSAPDREAIIAMTRAILARYPRYAMA